MFYLEKFCDDAISKKNDFGNLIAFETVDEGKASLMHGALNLNEFQMLEKNGSTGSLSPLSQHPDPIKKINKKDSNYISGDMRSGVSEIKIFECKDVKYIRKSLSEMAESNQALKEINLAIATMSNIVKGLDASSLKLLTPNLKRIIENLNKLNGKSIADLYTLVRATSLSGQIYLSIRELDPNFENKLDPELISLKREFNRSIDFLIVRLEANLKDSKSQRIISESKRHM